MIIIKKLDKGSIPSEKFPNGICHENDKAMFLCWEKLNTEAIKREKIEIIETYDPVCDASSGFFLRKNDNIPLPKSKKMKKSIKYIL